MNFKEWLTSEENEPVIAPASQAQTPVQPQYSTEPWKANKKQVIQHWKGISPNTPLGLMKVIPYGHKGRSMNYDGIRITGSAGFVNYAMSRLKELLAYESGKTRLEVMYKQQVNKKQNTPVPDSYMFYVQCKQRH